MVPLIGVVVIGRNVGERLRRCLTRTYRNNRRRGLSRRDARDWAVFRMISNFPGLLGQDTYVRASLPGRRVPIMEYRAEPRSGGASRSN